MINFSNISVIQFEILSISLSEQTLRLARYRAATVRERHINPMKTGVERCNNVYHYVRYDFIMK
jgi:hypothetical protein